MSMLFVCIGWLTDFAVEKCRCLIHAQLSILTCVMWFVGCSFEKPRVVFV
jgi:hypothetical protein